MVVVVAQLLIMVAINIQVTSYAGIVMWGGKVVF
jgi:hypothetical protein